MVEGEWVEIDGELAEITDAHFGKLQTSTKCNTGNLWPQLEPPWTWRFLLRGEASRCPAPLTSFKFRVRGDGTAKSTKETNLLLGRLKRRISEFVRLRQELRATAAHGLLPATILEPLQLALLERERVWDDVLEEVKASGLVPVAEVEILKGRIRPN